MNIQDDIWSRLLIAACMLQTACDEEPGEFDELEDPDLDTARPRSLSHVAPAGAHPMHTASGTKVVVGNDNRLHAVFKHGDTIRYITSVDGLVWTAPVTLAGGANNMAASLPTLAVAADGTLGVAYRWACSGPNNYACDTQQSQIRYLFKPLNGQWSLPFKVTADASSGPGGVNSPSIVALGTRMHLAWSKSASVYYASFPATQTVPVATAERVDHNNVVCGQEWPINQPAIAVSERSASDPNPRVRIAFFDKYNFGCTEELFGITVAERDAIGASWQYVKERTFSAPFGENFYDYPYTLSHAAIPTTGDFYVGVSFGDGDTDTTEIWYENAWRVDTWRSVAVYPYKSYVDVSAKVVDCLPTFRYALNHFYGVPGESGEDFAGYGQTLYRTGRWSTAQAAAPTWTDPGALVIDDHGATPEALFFRRTNGNSTRHVPVVYARWILNGGTSIVEETFTVPAVPGPAQNPCKQPQPLVGLGGHSSIAADAE